MDNFQCKRITPIIVNYKKNILKKRRRNFAENIFEYYNNCC